MKTRFRRFFCATFVFPLMLLSIMAFGQVWAAQELMPVSRLAEHKNVKWTALSSPQKAVARVQPTLMEAKAKLKLTVPGYEIAPVLQEKINFHRVDVPGAGVTPMVGQPELPIIRRFVAIPEGADVSVKFKAGQARTMPNIQVYPVQEPLPEAPPNLPYSIERKFAFNRDFYLRDQIYPAKLVTVSPPMKLRNVTVVQVEIAVMQYNGKRKLLSIYPDVEVELSFSKPFTPQTRDSKPGMLLPSKPGPAVAASKLGSAKLSTQNIAIAKPYRADFNKLIINWDWIRDIISHLKWDYLIITPDAFYNDIQPLATWKRTKGLNVQVTKLSAISAAPTAAQIRDYIKKAYEDHDVDFVLLVGDTNTMPGYNYTGSSGTITDYYYTLVSGSDYLPDLALGRFSGRTSAEIASLVTKTVKYEQTPTAGSWKRRAVCISDSGYFQDTSNYNYANLVANGFTVDKIYASLGNATVTNVANAINNGRLLVSYRGHGFQTGWSTSGFSNANVNTLTNGTMLPVIISPTCLTGMYDYATSDSFSEAWAKTGSAAVQRGAVAYWGSARISYGGYNDELSKGAFDEILAGNHVMGNVVNAAKLHMISHYGLTDSTSLLELHMFNLFGDPNLQINF